MVKQAARHKADPKADGISMIEAPAQPLTATFGPDFGQRVLLTVDTEEEFDWDGPFTRDAHGTKHVEAIPRFQKFCEEIGARPVYLVDWPIANDPRSIEIIGDAVKRGTAEVGVQLHPWVNPPFDEEVCPHNSYAGNLPRELEAAKFTTLRDRIEEAFGASPQIYRAGRYGLGPNSAEMLKSGGIAIDTSVRSLFDYSHGGGPDYSDHPSTPYWVDEERALLELPVTTVYWGMLRQLGKHIHRAQRHLPTFFGGFSKLGLLERIALTPEGVTIDEAIRGIDIAIDQNLPVLVLSFHSPTLAPGNTEYAEDEAGVERIYDWLRRVYAYLDQRGVRSVTAHEINAAVQRN